MGFTIILKIVQTLVVLMKEKEKGRHECLPLLDFAVNYFVINIFRVAVKSPAVSV